MSVRGRGSGRALSEEGGLGMAVAKSQGPLELLRQGVALYRRGFALFTTEFVILQLANILVFAFLASAHVLPVRAPKTWSAGLVLALFSWGFAVVEIVFQIGLMRGLANVADGRDARFMDLLWGVKRGEAWLLAIVLQVLGLVIFQVLAWFTVASGMHATGNPHHPFVLLDGPLWPFLSLLTAILALGIFGNTAAMAMAMASRHALPAFAALRAALKTFRHGYRRYLFLNFAGIGVLTGVGLTIAGISIVLLILLHFLGAGPIGHALRALVFLAALCAFVTAALMWAMVLLAAFVTASGMIGPANRS